MQITPSRPPDRIPEAPVPAPYEIEKIRKDLKDIISGHWRKETIHLFIKQVLYKRPRQKITQHKKNFHLLHRWPGLFRAYGKRWKFGFPGRRDAFVLIDLG